MFSFELRFGINERLIENFAHWMDKTETASAKYVSVCQFVFKKTYSIYCFSWSTTGSQGKISTAMHRWRLSCIYECRLLIAEQAAFKSCPSIERVISSVSPLVSLFTLCRQVGAERGVWGDWPSFWGPQQVCAVQFVLAGQSKTQFSSFSWY